MCWPDVATDPPAASVWPGVGVAGGAHFPPAQISSPTQGIAVEQETGVHTMLRHTPVPAAQSLDVLHAVPVDGWHMPPVSHNSPARHLMVALHGVGLHVPSRHTPVPIAQSVDDLHPAGAAVWQPATASRSAISKRRISPQYPGRPSRSSPGTSILDGTGQRVTIP